MNALLLTLGSQGDVQPFVALGKGLRQAGFSVTVCTSNRFRPFVEAHELTYAYMNSELIALTEDPEARRALEGSKRKALALMGRVKPIIRKTLDEAWAAAREADVIIYHPKALAGYSLAEKLGIPSFLSLPLPLMTPTHAFPNPLFPNLKLGSWANRSSYLTNRFATAPYQGVLNDWRQNVLGLPKQKLGVNVFVKPNGEAVATLYSYSSHVVPEPDDWPESTHTTGYWFLDERSYEPPSNLRAFLESGPPPVYVGFGSIAGSDPAATTKVVLEALELGEQRGVLATGWGGLAADTLPETVFKLESAPHDWLFPRMAAVVHHGGAGTTAAGLRAGKPSVICPFFGDQPFWGKRVHDLGVGPAPLPQKKLTADALAAAIGKAATDNKIRQKAQALGQKLQAEDGVGVAVQVIQAKVGAP